MAFGDGPSTNNICDQSGAEHAGRYRIEPCFSDIRILTRIRTIVASDSF